MIADFPPMEAWEEFKRMRKGLRKPMTAYAEGLMLNRLRKLVGDEGQDAKSVLDQSIMNSWQNVYPVRVEQKQQQATAPAQLRVVPNPNWWCSDGGIIAKGRELKMDPRPGESYGAFKDRIFAKLDDVNTRRGSA